MQIKKIIWLILSILILIPSVSAGQITITSIVSPSESETIEFDQTQSFSITFSQSNVFCSVICDYEVSGGVTGDSSGSFTLNPSPDTKTITFYKKAPHRGKGTDSLIVEINCVEKTLICGSDRGGDTKLISLNYELPYLEKQAKLFLNSNLLPLTSQIENFQKESYNLDSKINGLDSLIIANDLKNKNKVIQENYNDINTAFDKSFNEFNNQEYVNSQALFSFSWDSSIISNLNLITNLKSKIEQRVKQHNEVINRLNSLIDNINKQADLASLANSQLEFDNIKNSAKAIENNLKLNLYNSYDEINNAMIEPEQSIIILINKWKNIIESQTKSIKELLTQEIDKACQKANLCSFNVPTSTGELYIKTSCEGLNNISKGIAKFNTQELNSYRDASTNIQNYNNKAKHLNVKFNELKSLISKIERSINEYRVEIETNQCENPISEIIKKNEQDELVNEEEISLAISKCNDVYEKSLEINTEEEAKTLSGFKRLLFKIISFFNNKKSFNKIPLYEIKEEPIKPEAVELNQETTQLLDSICKRFGLISKVDSSLREALTPTGQELQDVDTKDIKKIENECCIFGQCRKCCEGNGCSSDSSTYPVLLVHGHSVYGGFSALQNSIDALNKIQNKLFEDGFVKVGILLPTESKTDIPYGEWGKSGIPITLRTTYYLNLVNKEGKVIGEINKERGIKDYAQTLSHIVDTLRHRTGKDKINIISFSMGGLVSRSYIKDFGGASKVNKLITIGTPNHGYYSIDAVNFACGLFGLWQTKECEDMDSESTFIENLNNHDISKSGVDVITIAGNCGSSSKSGQPYDNIVRVESVALDGVPNYVVNCDNPHTFWKSYHLDLVDPDISPEVYNYVKEFLKS